MKKNNFKIFCWNIGNPSKERAKKQALFLFEREEDLFVLTETKKSEGCFFLRTFFKSKGYSVRFPEPKEGEYGVMLISKKEFNFSLLFNEINFLSSRITSIKNGGFKITGLYVPARGSDTGAKKKKKQKFIKKLCDSFEEKRKLNNFIFCGDLNILSPDHLPAYKQFQKWEYEFYKKLKKSFKLKDAFRVLNPNKQEYSWFGRTGNGYRYDHCFISSDLKNKLEQCYYFHKPRKSKLSDHSALIIELAK